MGQVTIGNGVLIQIRSPSNPDLYQPAISSYSSTGTGRHSNTQHSMWGRGYRLIKGASEGFPWPLQVTLGLCRSPLVFTRHPQKKHRSDPHTLDTGWPFFPIVTPGTHSYVRQNPMQTQDSNEPVWLQVFQPVHVGSFPYDNWKRQPGAPGP